MAKNVKDQGNYELFETTHQHRILVLKGKKLKKAGSMPTFAQEDEFVSSSFRDSQPAS